MPGGGFVIVHLTVPLFAAGTVTLLPVGPVK